MNCCRLPVAALLVILGCLQIPAAHAELEVALYSGEAYVPDADVDYSRTETELTLHDVSWETRSFESPIYYGVRLNYWTQWNRRVGLSLDFAHSKIYAEAGETVRVTGFREGVAVDAEEPLANTLQSFNNSHGLNLLTLNILYRWSPDSARATNGSWRLQPYIGVGGGVAYPRVEARVDGRETSEYQLAGPAVQAQAGLRYGLTDRLGLFTEYKYNRAWLDESLNGGGSLELEPHVHQFVFGVAYTF